MVEVAVTAYAVGGRSLTSASLRDPSVWLPPAKVEEFAVRKRKVLRFLNHGSVLTAAVTDAALQQRWPEGTARPARLAFCVGSAFGNEAETARYFLRIWDLGASEVGPMESYDVACNSFVNFCSIFFGFTGTVRMMSSGSTSSGDALVSALCQLRENEADAVVLVGAEQPSAIVRSYSSARVAPDDGIGEVAVALVLERDCAARRRGWIVEVECGFCDPRSGKRKAVVGAILERLLRAVHAGEELRVVVAGPPWTDTAELARGILHAPRAAWIDPTAVAEPWQVGATGALGCVTVLDYFSRTGLSGLGLVMTCDPEGWTNAILLRVDGTSAAAVQSQEVETCRP
jgi:Beta-ketoacyl synthase, N-terminal domain